LLEQEKKLLFLYKPIQFKWDFVGCFLSAKIAAASLQQAQSISKAKTNQNP